MKPGQLMLVGALLGGCTVMVNGKPRRLGGSDPQPAAAAPGAPAPSQGRPDEEPPPAAQAPRPAPAAARVIAVDPALGRDPLVVAVTGAFDTSWSKVFGHGSVSPECGMGLPTQPIASFEIKQPDTTLHVAVIGARNDGFVVRKGTQYWTTCTHTTSQLPAMAPVKGGWQPGRYDIFPVSRGSTRPEPVAFSVELYRPEAPVAWTDQAQKLVISGKLEKPMFVELTTRAGRRTLRDAHAGSGCSNVALPATPDLAVTIERPIPGLTIRPMPSVVPVTLRREGIAETAKVQRGCLRSGGNRNRNAPSYTAPSELHFEREAEGTYGLSLGTPDATTETKVTLMVFDDSTKFDALAVRPYAGESPTLDQRWIGFYLPQLDLDELGVRDYAHAELTARVFAAVPKQALVYAKLDWDKDLAGGDAAAYPVKNEPLAVVGLERERVTVIAADGLKYTVKATHVVLAPDGAPALLAKPRALRKLGIVDAIQLLPPSAKKLGEAHYKRIEARGQCRDRVWAPYGRQLPSYSRPAGVDIVVYKSARTRQIEDAGEAAMDRTCGTDEQSEKLTEATRIKLLVEIDKARAKLLAEATR